MLELEDLKQQHILMEEEKNNLQQLLDQANSIINEHKVKTDYWVWQFFKNVIIKGNIFDFINIRHAPVHFVSTDSTTHLIRGNSTIMRWL